MNTARFLCHINSFLTPPQASFLQASDPPVTSPKQGSQSPVPTGTSRPLAFVSSTQFSRQYSQTHSTFTQKHRQSSVPMLQPLSPSTLPPHNYMSIPQWLTFISPRVPHELLLAQLPLLQCAQPPALFLSLISFFIPLRSLLGSSQHSSI